MQTIQNACLWNITLALHACAINLHIRTKIPTFCQRHIPLPSSPLPFLRPTYQIEQLFAQTQHRLSYDLQQPESCGPTLQDEHATLWSIGCGIREYGNFRSLTTSNN